MNTLNTTTPDVTLIREGNLLRQMKQMALRGRGREYDPEGVCGKQTVVYTW